MKFAIVKLGGKQFKIQEGSTIKVERQPKVAFDVLLYSNAGDVLVGSPLLEDIVVKAHVVEEIKEKTTISRFRAKSRYRKTKGHKQPISIVKIDSILKAGEVASEAPAAKKTAEKPAKKTVSKEKSKTTVKSTTKKGASKKEK